MPADVEDVEVEIDTVAAKLTTRRQASATSSDPPSQPASGAGSAGSAAVTGKVGPQGQSALLADEVKRARGMAAVLGMISTVAIFWFAQFGGSPELRIAAIASCAYMAVVCLVVNRRARPDRHYRFLFRWFAVSCAVVSLPIQYYIGLFSPAPIIVTLGVSFVGGADDRVWSLGATLGATAGYMIMTFLIMVGVIPDLGLIRGLSLPLIQLFAVIMVPAVFVATIWQASLARRAAHEAMRQVEDALAVVQRREAQLAEVNLDLQNALDAGAGHNGRHTGKRAGAWVLGPVIGRGAMGEVYGAVHAESGASAAVKILVGNPAPDAIARFKREAEIATRLRVPTVVALHDAGTLEGDMPYLAMELLTGHDLAWHLRKLGQLTLDDAVKLAREVAAGLGAAHRAGIVHRDIKPQNLMLHEPPRETPIWKILDFGVSKLQGSQGTLTQDRVVGTPGYMSPEQARGHDADERSDLFSLGAVLYRALTGQPPFMGRDTPQVLFDVVYRMPRRPTALAPALPADVDLVLALALAKEPADRFDGPEPFAAALRAAAAGGLDATTRGRGQAVITALPWGRSAGIRRDSVAPDEA